MFTAVFLLVVLFSSLQITECNKSSHKEILEKLHELSKLDIELCENGRELVGVILSTSKISKIQKHGLQNIQLAGSFAEGATVARLFGKNNEFQDQVNRELEVDIEYMLVKMPINMKEEIVDIDSRQGYVKVKSSSQLIEQGRNIGWNINDKDVKEVLTKITSPDGWFQPYKLKKTASEKVAFKDPHKAIELIIAAALEKKKDDVRLSPTRNDVTKSSVASEFMVWVHGTKFLKVSFDTVPLFGLSWPPSIGNEWKNRNKKWPSKNVVEQLMHTGFIIAKPSVAEKYNEESVEMRYAFAHVERELVRMRSKQQQFIYLIFKSMLVKWIKPINLDQISSFIGKTVMFWVCEEFPPQHKMWKTDFESMLNTIKYLFSHLLSAFKQGKLPYFFNQQVNVIETLPDADKNLVISKINDILKNLVKYLPLEMEKELKAGREMLAVVKSTIEVLKELKRKDYTRLLKQPELILDALELFIDEIDLKNIGHKIEREVKRVGKQIEKEASRFVDSAKDEIKRFADRFGL